MYSKNRERDAELCGFKEITPKTKEDAHKLIDGITAKALNEDQDAADAIGLLEEKIKEAAGGGRADLLAVFISGVHAGSVAVARKWVNAEPASAIGYWTGHGTRKGAVVIPFPEASQ
jgi:hypothetical protein